MARKRKSQNNGIYGGRRYSGSRHNGGNQERAQSVSSISAEAMRAELWAKVGDGVKG
jgi:hypothetical protein